MQVWCTSGVYPTALPMKPYLPLLPTPRLVGLGSTLGLSPASRSGKLLGSQLLRSVRSITQLLLSRCSAPKPGRLDSSHFVIMSLLLLLEPLWLWLWPVLLPVALAARVG